MLGNTEGTAARAYARPRVAARPRPIPPLCGSSCPGVALHAPVPVSSLHGKEGVDGSSPSEGLKKRPANGHVVLPAMTRSRLVAGTRRVHFGTSGHARRLGDTAWNVLGSLDHQKSPCKRAVDDACIGAMLTPSFSSEGVIRFVLAASSVETRRVPNAYRTVVPSSRGPGRAGRSPGAPDALWRRA